MRMRKFIFKYKETLGLSFLFIFLASMLNIALALLLEKIIDVVEVGDISKFMRVVVITILFIIGESVISYLKAYFKNSYIKKTMYYIKNDIFKEMLKKKSFEFYRSNSAKYISLLSNDIKMIEEDYLNTMFLVFENLILFVGSLISLFLLNYEITIILIVITSLTMVIPKIFEKKLSDKKAFYSEKLEKFTIGIKDIFTGFEVIKAFSVEEKINNEYRKLNFNVEESKYKFEMLSSLANTVSLFTGSSMFMGIVIVGTYLCIKGNITLGTMLACIQLTNNVTNPIFNSIAYINIIKSMKSIKEKILSIYSEDEEDKKEYISKDSFDREIEIKNLSFYYEDMNYVLKNINFNIEKNKKYAIVGMSGCGKSTLMKILSKQLVNYEGEVKLDGFSLKDLRTEDICNMMAIIHQNVFLFDDTIKNNITLFNNYDDKDVSNCMNISGLKKFREKLDMVVGEGGNLLSGGEKQRISIARALITKTPILMLDEATASLDSKTSYEIENTILDIKDKTVIIITHKLNESILKKYDGIIVLKDGCLIENGTFEELINNKGYFYSLYNTCI